MIPSHHFTSSGFCLSLALSLPPMDNNNNNIILINSPVNLHQQHKRCIRSTTEYKRPIPSLLSSAHLILCVPSATASQPWILYLSPFTPLLLQTRLIPHPNNLSHFPPVTPPQFVISHYYYSTDLTTVTR